MFDVGLGLEFDMDSTRLKPRMQLKFCNLAAIRLLPSPVLRLHKTLDLGFSGLAVRLEYDCPLGNLDRFWEPPARAMIRLESSPGSGVRLSPLGVELDEVRFGLGEAMRVRAAASVPFPRQFPVEDGANFVKVDVHRLGLKARW